MPPSLSYFHILSFSTAAWPVGFTTVAQVSAPGHMHEVLAEGDWSWEEVQHEHNKVVRAVQESDEKEGNQQYNFTEGDKKSQAAAAEEEEADEQDEVADEEMEEAEDEGREWEEGEEGEEDEEEDEEFDDEDEDDEGEEEDSEEEDEEEVEGEDEGQAGNDAAAQQTDGADQPQPAIPPRYIDLRALYQMLDVLDNLTRNIPPLPQPADNQPADNNNNGPMMVRDRREFHRFFGRVFRVQGTDDEVAEAAEAFMARRRRAEEERGRRQERRRREEERREQMIQRAFVDVGTLMDDDDDTSRRARRKQQRKVEKQQQRWRHIVEATITRRPAPTYSSSDDEDDSDDEKKQPTSAFDRSEQVATRLRYANNTHGDDRAVVLDRPFPMRLADHAVPFSVVEVVTRERLEAMLREQERVDETRRRQAAEDSKRQEEGSGKEEKQEDETSRKRRNDQSREIEEKKQKTHNSLPPDSLLPLTRTRSLSNLSSPYYTLCRLSMIAYFEVHIEEADAEEVNRRELRQKEEREKRRQERQATREQRVAAGEQVGEEEEEAEEQQAEHHFSRHPDCVSVGLANSSFSLFGKQPGWDRHSYGYHGDDGAVFHGTGVGSKSFGPTFGVGDVVGCGLDYRDGSVFFTKNGRFAGVHPSTRSADGEDSNGLLGEWYGVVGLDSGSVVRVSVAGPWVFDVASYERQSGRRQPVGWEVGEVDAAVKSGVTGVRLSPAVVELKRLWRIETQKRRAV